MKKAQIMKRLSDILTVLDMGAEQYRTHEQAVGVTPTNKDFYVSAKCGEAMSMIKYLMEDIAK